MSSGVFNFPPGPVVMGVLNLDKLLLKHDNMHSVVEQALIEAEKILADGATILDLSSSNSDNPEYPLSVQEELDLFMPVVEVISNRINIPISVDTSNAEVMLAVSSSGAKIINDIRALTKLNALSTVASLRCYVCLMHMHSDPVTLKLASDKEIVSEVYQYLEQRIAACEAAGIDRKRIIVDPGFGFGKTFAQNLNLLRSLHIFKNLNCPILVDISHKSMIGQILDETVENRIFGSIAAEVIAISKGADIIRSHDVRATVDAIKVIKAVASL